MENEVPAELLSGPIVGRKGLASASVATRQASLPNLLSSGLTRAPFLRSRAVNNASARSSDEFRLVTGAGPQYARAPGEKPRAAMVAGSIA